MRADAVWNFDLKSRAEVWKNGSRKLAVVECSVTSWLQFRKRSEEQPVHALVETLNPSELEYIWKRIADADGRYSPSVGAAAADPTPISVLVISPPQNDLIRRAPTSDWKWPRRMDTAASVDAATRYNFGECCKSALLRERERERERERWAGG